MDNELNDWLAVAGDPDISAEALEVLVYLSQVPAWSPTFRSRIAQVLADAGFAALVGLSFAITEAGRAYLRRRGFV